MAIDNRLRVYDEQGNPVDYDILASDVKFMPDGKDLPTKLAEMQDEIDEAAQTGGDGTVTGVKVGTTPYNPDSNGVVDLSMPFNGKVDKDPNKELIPSTDLAKLQNLPTADQLTSQLSSKANDADVVKSVSVNGTAQAKDGNGNVNIEVQGGGESIVFDTEGTPIIDSPLSPNADTVLGAASARWVKEIDNNVKAILAALANIAFTTGKPTWDAVQKRKFNLTMNASTLTGCTGAIVSGDAGNGQVYEGGVQIKLTPNTAYTFASIKVNGEDVASTPTGDSDNSVIIDIIVNQNITVTATAVSGFAIAVSGSHVTNSQSHSGSTYTVTLGSDNQHFHLPDTITVKHGQTVLTVNTHYTYNKNTGEVVISNVNDNTYSIEVTMVEDAKYNVTLDATGLTGALAVLSASQVYAGESATITITPNSGYTLNSIKYAINSGTQQDATISNNQAVITLSNINENKSVVVTGSASIPTELNLNLKWFEEPATQPSISGGVPFSLDLIPLTDFVAAATQDAGTANEKAIRAAVQVVMNGTDITNDTGVVTFDETNNKVTISIANPNGSVTINATARAIIVRDARVNSYGNVVAAGSPDKNCATRSIIPVPTGVVPTSTGLKWYAYIKTLGYDAANSVIAMYNGTERVTDGYWNGYSADVRQITASEITQYAPNMNGFKATFAISVINDDTHDSVGVVFNETWAITKDDLQNALYVNLN